MDGTVRVRSVTWFAIGMVVTLLATVIVLQTWRADAAPGEDDATLVPITPCRLVDTRQPGGAPLQPGETRTIDAHGTNGPIAGSECSIPTDAVALSMNATADQPSAQSFWTFWPDGQPRPNASNLNPGPGEPPTPNAVTTPISSVGRFNVYNDAGSVDMIIDVNGYYSGASLQDLAARLAAAETDIAALDRRQPFIVASAPIDTVQVQSTPTKIRWVTVDAPVNGHVAVIASGYMSDADDGHETECGLMNSVIDPPPLVQVRWQSPLGGDRAHLSTSRVFDISARGTTTYYLVCHHLSNGTSRIGSPQVTAIFTPAP